LNIRGGCSRSGIGIGWCWIVFVYIKGNSSASNIFICTHIHDAATAGAIDPLVALDVFCGEYIGVVSGVSARGGAEEAIIATRNINQYWFVGDATRCAGG